MKIVQIANGMVRIPPQKGGGSESTLFFWSKGLAELENEVVILDRKYSDFDRSENVDGVKIVRLEAKCLRSLPFEKVPRIGGAIRRIRMNINLLTFVFAAVGFLRVNETDIIQTHYLLHAIALLILYPASRKRLFFAVHSTFWADSPWCFGSWWGSLRETTVMKRMAGIRVQNRIEQERCIALGVCAEKLLLLGPPIDTRLWESTSVRLEKKEYTRFEDKVVLLFVGRIVKDKGLEYLVKALDILVGEYQVKNVLLMLVGPLGDFHEAGDYYIKTILPSIKQYQLSNYIQITGALHEQELLKMFAICDIFVLPSIREGTPTVSVQAMSFAKPVIASKVGGNPEEIREGINGLLFEPRNAGQLAQKIKFLIEHVDVRLRMGLNGRKIAVDEYDYRIASKKLLQLYKSAMS